MLIAVTKENKSQKYETWRAHEVNIKTVSFWDVTHSSLVDTYWSFGRKICLHFQSGKVKQNGVAIFFRGVGVPTWQPKYVPGFRNTY
jgi:hypothetical protein